MECGICADRESVITSGGGFSIKTPLGPLADGHVLVATARHLPCMADLSPAGLGDLERLARELREIVSRLYRKPVLVFEHGKFGQSVPHAHLQLLPLREQERGAVWAEVEGELRRSYVTDWLRFSALIYPALRGYVFLDSGRTTWFDPYATFQENRQSYLREKIARLTGQPHLQRWQSLSGEEREASRQRAAETRRRLAPLLGG